MADDIEIRQEPDEEALERQLNKLPEPAQYHARRAIRHLADRIVKDYVHDHHVPAEVADLQAFYEAAETFQAVGKLMALRVGSHHV